MSDDVLEAEAVEEPLAGGAEADDGEQAVRPLPQRRPARELDAWRGEIRTVAIAAAGGIAAGAATIAAAGAVRARAERKRPRGLIRRRGRSDNVVASRSFLIDVHVLGR